MKHLSPVSGSVSWKAFAVMVLMLPLLSSCGSRARYVQSGGAESLVSLGQVNMRDFDTAANQMVQSLLARGIFQNAARKPVVLAVNPVMNDTSIMLDTEQLTDQIRVALNQTGDVETITTLGGYVEDSIAREQREQAAFRRGVAPESRVDYSLSGAIRELAARSGRDRERTYTFKLSLTDSRTGRAVWEDMVRVSKQATKPGIGW